MQVLTITKRRIQQFINQVSPTKFFVMAGLFFGLIFIIITPPFQSPDEQAHFLKAYHVSQFDFMLVENEAGLLGGYLPESLGEVIRTAFVHPASPGYIDEKDDIYKTIEVAKLKTEPSRVKFYDLSATGLNPPTSYLPQAVGIGIARAFYDSPLVSMYIGRLFNTLAWVAACALAIHLIPRKKWAIVFLGLLPMMVSQAASNSADVVAIGSLLVYLSYILHLKEVNKQLGSKQLALLLLFASIVTIAKQTMFIFLPLVLLIPDRLFARKKFAYIVKMMLICIPVILLAGWLVINRELSEVAASAPNRASPLMQLEFVLRNPHSFINVLWNTHFTGLGDTITKSFIGTFGWVNVNLPAAVVVIGYIAMALILLIDTSQRKAQAWLTGQQKLLIGLIAGIYWIAINAALYIFNSPVGFKVIIGLQGRYFMPAAILLVPLLYGSWLKTTKTIYRRIAIFAPIFLLLASIYIICVRYYINNL